MSGVRTKMVYLHEVSSRLLTGNYFKDHICASNKLKKQFEEFLLMDSSKKVRRTI